MKNLQMLKCLGKKAVSAVLICGMMAGTVPSRALHVRAAKVSKVSAYKEITEQSGEAADPFAPEEGHSLKTRAVKPAYFDLRHVNEGGTEKSYVTPVREQSPYGTCWGFGAIAAAESSILSTGLANDPKTLNLSEKQVAWFTANEIKDTKNPQYGEGFVYDKGISDSDRYNQGGFTLYATSLFASGTGPVSEKRNTEDGDIFYYSGRGKKVVNESVTWLDEQGTEQSGYRKTFYSTDDDWAIPDKYRFTQDYRLKESYLLPSPSAKKEGGNIAEYVPEATEAIKDQLLQKRAVSIFIYADHSTPGDRGDEGAHFGDFWAQYDTDTSTNHVVTIVGYDDNFPVSLFKKGKQPPGKGAWLVKNSWGADTNTFPDNSYRHWGLLEGQDRPGTDYKATSNKHTGYYWVSYYDRSLSHPEAYYFDSASSEDRTLYQHDLLPVAEYRQYATDATLKMANVFTATANGKLDEVSFFTATPGTTVTYKVYLLYDKWFDPEEDGYCVYESKAKTYPLGGYHRVSLPEDSNIVIARNQQYVVVVEQETPSGKSSISFGTTPAGNLGGCHANAVINSKESLLYMDGEWRDLKDKSLQDLLLNDPEDNLMDNFPIKTSLKPVSNQGMYLKLMNLKDADMTMLLIHEEHPIGAYFEGATDDLPITPDIRWESSNPSIFTVKTTSPDHGKAVLTGVGPGRALLTVDAGIYGKRFIWISVYKFGISYIYLGDDVVVETYDGQAHKPEVIDVYGDTVTETGRWGLKEGQDYRLSYEDNVKCGKGRVILDGINDFAGQRESWFVIRPAKAKINKTEVKENGMTVSFESQKDSSISGYLLTYKETDSGKTQTMKVDPEKTSVEIKGLTEGRTYEVSLKAYVTVEEDDFLLINRQTFEERMPAEEPVDYFGEESDKVVSDEIPGKADVGPSDGSAADPASVAGTEKAIKEISNDKDLADASFCPLRLASKKVANTKIQVGWQKVTGADGYILYGNRCGSAYKMQRLKDFDGTKNSWTYTGLKKGVYYKFMIVAFKIENHERKVIAESTIIHSATSGGKNGNHKSVKLNKTKISLKVGKTFKLKATAVPASKKKKPKKHVGVRYESSNPAVATVSISGKITAKAKGTCTIYAYAQKGVYKSAKVTVK